MIVVNMSFFSKTTSRMDYDYYDYEDAASGRDSGYGHSSLGTGYGGHEDHGGHGSYGGYKVQPKPPGPYGYPSPNFKCEKTSETLYVTETEMTYDKKCYNVYKTKCQDGYDEGKVSGFVCVCPAIDGCCLDFVMAMAMSPFSLHHKTFYEL